MTDPRERIDTARRAMLAWEEFFEPMIGELRDAYAERIIEIANTDLNPRKRADKLTALSNAMKILQTLESGMREILRDGELAKRDSVRAEKIETMSPSQRRLLGIAPY